MNFSMIVNVYFLTMFCANAARTWQRKKNYSMVSVSVEESFLFLKDSQRLGFTLKERCVSVKTLREKK